MIEKATGEENFLDLMMHRKRDDLLDLFGILKYAGGLRNVLE